MAVFTLGSSINSSTLTDNVLAKVANNSTEMRNLRKQRRHPQLFFIGLVIFISTLSPPIQANQGQTVFIPIAVGDITIFIPIMPSSSSGSVTGTSTDGRYDLSWSAVS
ncbi:hypothetical protein, partial [Shewanella sp.]|uniref:hypothetical protein n=1 Tax=Shewanella sp. TaxID=50422 RepID=UPI001EC4E59B